MEIKVESGVNFKTAYSSTLISGLSRYSYDWPISSFHSDGPCQHFILHTSLKYYTTWPGLAARWETMMFGPKSSFRQQLNWWKNEIDEQRKTSGCLMGGDATSNQLVGKRSSFQWLNHFGWVHLQVLIPGSDSRFSFQILLSGSHSRFSFQVLLPDSPSRFSFQVLLPGSHSRFSFQVLLPGSPSRFSFQVLIPGSYSRSLPVSLWPRSARTASPIRPPFQTFQVEWCCI